MRIKEHCLFSYPREVEYVPIGQQVRQQKKEEVQQQEIIQPEELPQEAMQ